MKNKISIEYYELAKECLSYNSETGIVTWKTMLGKRAPVGKRAGCRNKQNGYRTIRLNNKNISEHSIIWYIVFGKIPEVIDHINGVRDDNRLENIRECTYYENQMNRKGCKNNTSGYKNVWWNPRYRKWEVRGSVKGKRHYLGRYTDKVQASEVYNNWARENHKEFYKEE